ncbi:MAG: hypothetical protein HC915_05990 [Anaerolineae bacterium]|nr:hypothetical protein [Anaerolineae bacterium]
MGVDWGGGGAPCADLRLQSWWTSQAVPLDNYSLTLVLRDEAGNPVINKDGAPGDTLMLLWEPGQLTFDERVLTLPCELPAGTYELVLGFYSQQDGTFVDLPAFGPEGAELGNRAVLTYLEVG